MTIGISNNSLVTMTGIGFIDTLPANMVVASPTGLTNTCGGGVAFPTAGSSLELAGGTLAAQTQCTVSVNVTASVVGVYTNTTGPVSSSQGNGTAATATLNVLGPPFITKQFFPTNIPLGGTSLLTISIVTGNPTPGLTGVGLIDNLPAGLVVATPNNLTNNCGGTVTATAGSNAITLTGGALGPTTVCNFSLNVTGTTVGTKTNTTGAVTSDQGTGNTATASVSVGLLTPPTISKVFGAASIPVNGTTSLTFTITNPNAATSISGVGFTDTLPAGLVVATPSGAAGTCSTAAQGVVTAVAGSGSVSMATANLQPNQSCSLSVNVKSTQLGVLVNTTGTVTSLEAGPGNTATASITVLANLIPTLSPAALGGFALLLAGLGAVLARKAQTPVN